MQTEHPKGSVRRFGWRFYFFAPMMAVLAPLLADSLHSLYVVHTGIRFYNAELGLIAWPGYWIFVALRGAVSFFVVWFFIWARFRDFWVWCCLAGLWLLLDLKAEYFTH
jgi:hypothetical protein